MFCFGIDTPGSCEAVFPGEHAFPFLFHLPETCPCSFTGTRGSVEYRLKVTLHLSNGDVYRSIKGFVVIRDVVIGEQLDIPSTLSCPPISRWFVSGFDLLSHSGAVDELTTLIRQRLRSNRFDEFGSCVIDGDRQCPPESFDPMLRWEAAETQQPNTSLLQVDGNFGQLRINQNRDLFSKRQPETLKDRLRRALTGNKYAGLQMSRATPPLHYSQCYNMSSLVPTSWISRPHTSEVTSYPRVAMGSQIGYAVSCRLTVSRRNMVPGERITTRLTLFVEDPFALVPLPKLTEDQCNRGSCTPFCCASFRQTKRVWSPLAKAFVSYFLEESYEQQLSDPYESSAIWWKGVVKQPHRIMVVLRQMTTYNDWTNHVIAEEERDIYMGEMERGQPTDKHLLRVSLEHVFNVPAVAPSNLDGTHCITVSYLLGVVHFKLKKYEHLWLPNEWRVHLNRCVKNAALRDIERMYIPYSSDVEPKSVRWSKRFVRQMQRKKRSSPATWKRIYSDLLLPIPIHIGTSKYGPSPGGDQDGLLTATSDSHWRYDHTEFMRKQVKADTVNETRTRMVGITIFRKAIWNVPASDIPGRHPNLNISVKEKIYLRIQFPHADSKYHALITLGRSMYIRLKALLFDVLPINICLSSRNQQTFWYKSKFSASDSQHARMSSQVFTLVQVLSVAFCIEQVTGSLPNLMYSTHHYDTAACKHLSSFISCFSRFRGSIDGRHKIVRAHTSFTVINGLNLTFTLSVFIPISHLIASFVKQQCVTCQSVDQLVCFTVVCFITVRGDIVRVRFGPSADRQTDTDSVYQPCIANTKAKNRTRKQRRRSYAPQNYERYLEEHNKYRRMLLDGRKWSAQLALLAQRSAEECTFEISEYPTTNANKAASPEHGYDVVKAWFDQHTHYKYGPFSTVDASHFEGYTQFGQTHEKSDVTGIYVLVFGRDKNGDRIYISRFANITRVSATVGLTPTEYLEKHNTYRTRLLRGDVSRQLQPRIMPNLTWNPSLASEAEASASRCKVNSDEIPATENIFASVSSTTETCYDLMYTINMFTVSYITSGMCKLFPCPQDLIYREKRRTKLRGRGVKLEREGFREGFDEQAPEKPFLFIILMDSMITMSILRLRSHSSTKPHDSRLKYLDRHNKYRAMILEGKVSGQPQALLMPNLTWSDSLEQEAKHQAEMCDSPTRILPGEARAISRVANLDLFGLIRGKLDAIKLTVRTFGYASTGKQEFTVQFVCTGQPSYNAKIAYLTDHNKYRNMVLEGQVPGQPQATVMPSLRWSDKLEQEAMHEAEKCTIPRETVPGEIRTYSRDGNFDVVKYWFDQHARYTYGRFPTQNSAQVSGYTQKYDGLRSNQAANRSLDVTRIQLITWSDVLEGNARNEAERCAYSVTGENLPGEVRAQSRRENFEVTDGSIDQLNHDCCLTVIRAVRKTNHNGQVRTCSPVWTGYFRCIQWALAEVGAVKNWFDQHLHYKYGRYPPENPDQVSGYTQLVWANTQTVGCYQAYCRHYWTGSTLESSIYNTVCRYWPPGNLDKEMPYEPSDPNKEDYLSRHNMYRTMMWQGKVLGQPPASVLPNLVRSYVITTKFLSNGGLINTSITNMVYIPRKILTKFRATHRYVNLNNQTEVFISWEFNDYHSLICTFQLVWARTQTVGCYRAYCNNFWTRFTWEAKIYNTVCRYWPPGNVDKELPYEHKKEVHPIGDTPANPEEQGWLDQHNTYRAMLLNGQIPGQPIPLKMPNLDLMVVEPSGGGLWVDYSDFVSPYTLVSSGSFIHAGYRYIDSLHTNGQFSILVRIHLFTEKYTKLLAVSLPVPGLLLEGNKDEGAARASNAQLPTSPPQIIGGRNCGSYNHCTTSTRFPTADDDDDFSCKKVT
ncbi:peptidase inhibitor 16 [Clonorchis sinensis]|uniref:Peptidase inhibitor 16 n=1 Tax=Clonorchis sinensis TaxID=79923 RepID=G7YF22_CLOSI|nr:peptidase inhibitor 16 [Clonorchis sinensis]